MSLLLDLCQWLNDLPPAQALSESEWAFPGIESVHVLSLALMAGTLALVDLRVLGLALPGVRVSVVARRLLPLTWAGFALMLTSGTVLFASEAVRLYDNAAFRVKLLLMLAAGLNAAIFHATVYARVGDWEDAATAPARARAAAALSLLLWVGIIVCGRFIAYFH
jgi:uncharacterized membrane protein